jgi:uncharacterized phiE125 gp8 family phage protein
MTKYDPILTSAPAVLPVSRDECKLHLRVDGTDEDSLIDIYLAAAVAHLDGEDGWLGRAIVAQTWAQSFDALARSILLGLAPATAISSVKYYDATGVLTTVDAANYALVNGNDAPEVRFIDSYAFPVVRTDRPTVVVTFVAGYGDDDDVPAAIKAGILLMVGDMYQSREAKVANDMIENSTVRRLLDPYRTRWMA